MEIKLNVQSTTSISYIPRVGGSVRLGSARFGSVGSVRFGSVRFGSVRKRFGSVRFSSETSRLWYSNVHCAISLHVKCANDVK